MIEIVIDETGRLRHDVDPKPIFIIIGFFLFGSSTF
jgi:hypothetical protein